MDTLTAPALVQPNLGNYDEVRRTFSWSRAQRALDGLPDGAGLNIAHEAVDRHVAGGRGEHVALRFVDRSGGRRELTYGQLAVETSRFANVLRSLGVGKGDRVFVLADRIPELYLAALGTLKNGSVFSPLFSAFGPDPIHQRLDLGQAKVLVTTERLFRRKVGDLVDVVESLEHVLLVRSRDGNADGEPPTGTRDLHRLMAEAGEHFEIPPTDPEDMALLHFTSGTTGTPKAAVHVHEAVVAHHATGGYVLDFHPGDVFWCTADPGWVTGTSYGIVSPFTHGVTSVVYEGDFDAEAWYRLIRDERVTVWYTAPTAIRMLMKAGTELARGFDLSSLRLVASVGEALNPEAVLWGEEALGLPILDNWWQTETGGIMIANYPGTEVRPGSMGRPVPGIDAGIVRRLGEEDGAEIEEVAEPGRTGELALRPVDVELTSEALTLRGQKEKESTEEGDNWYRRERTFGSFERMIPLPWKIDDEKAKADAVFENGLLTVTVDKPKEARPRAKKLQVKAA